MKDSLGRLIDLSWQRGRSAYLKIDQQIMQSEEQEKIIKKNE